MQAIKNQIIKWLGGYTELDISKQKAMETLGLIPKNDGSPHTAFLNWIDLGYEIGKLSQLTIDEYVFEMRKIFYSLFPTK